VEVGQGFEGYQKVGGQASGGKWNVGASFQN